MAGPAFADCKLNQIIELPVTMAGSRAQVTLYINGQAAKFNIDSGSDVSLIDPDAVAALGLKLADTDVYLKGIGGKSKLSFTTIKNLGLSKDLTIGQADMLVTPHAGDSGAVGLLGENLLGFADIEYDLPHGAIRFFRQEGCQGANLGYWDDKGAMEINLTHTAKRPLSRDRDPNHYDPGNTDRHVRAEAAVNGQKIIVTFDTGATSILNQNVAARAGVTPQTPGVVNAGLTGGFGDKRVSDWIGPFESFALGGERINHTRLRFSDLNEVQTDMLLGIDFFLSHRIFIANSLSKAFITYTGGPVFDLRARSQVAAAPSDPRPAQSADAQSADAQVRAASAMLTRRDFAGAAAALDAAISVEPNRAEAHVLRAEARLGQGDGKGAMEDLDEALKLDPANLEALLARGARLAGQGDMVGAKRDLDLAAGQKTPDGRARLRVAAIYQGVHDYPEAIAQFDAIIAQKATDHLAVAAYNGRCWDRALMKQDLDKAIADCNQALRLSPGNPEVLDSRALAHLRRGEIDLALADYDAVLRTQPETAITLYARGAARLQKGMKAESAADFAAARKLDPRIGARAKAEGVVEAELDASAPSKP